MPLYRKTSSVSEQRSGEKQAEAELGQDQLKLKLETWS